MSCKEVFEPKGNHETSLRELGEIIRGLGGDEDTRITIAADGEPVYIECYMGDRELT